MNRAYQAWIMHSVAIENSAWKLRSNARDTLIEIEAAARARGRFFGRAERVPTTTHSVRAPTLPTNVDRSTPNPEFFS
jgi:hypothetical protein